MRQRRLGVRVRLAVRSQAVTVPKGVALAFTAALGATLVMAAPVALAPGTRLFGSGQTFAREDPNRDPLIVMEQFRTGRVAAPYLQPLTDLPGRALARLVGPVAAYNVLVLATFPLAAAAAYLLARYVLGSHLGAMVAGLAYAFLPFHVAHATNHPHVAQTQWLPLYFLALWRCLDRPDPRRALLLLAAAAAAALSNFYAGFIAAVLTPVALVAYGVASPGRPRDGSLRRVAITSLVLATAAAAGFLLIHHVAAAVVLRSETFAVPRSDLFLHSAKWWSYLVPAADHPLAGARVREFWAARGLEGGLLEQQVGLGWSLVALAAVPLWLWVRGDRTSLARCAPVLASVAVAALLCSLSPERRIGSLTFVRPSALLYEVAPMFRAYARFGVVVGLMTALLAGAGAACLWRRPTSAGRRAAALLLGLVVLELAPFPPWRWRDVLPTRAHRWLAMQPGPLRVLDCVPPSRVSDSLAVTLLGHEVSLLGAPAFDDCGEPRLGDRLKAMGYTHVVVRRDGTRGSLRELPDGLARGPEFEDAQILEVKAEQPAVYVSALLGFYPREYEGKATWRWMGQTGALRIAATRESAGTSLELQLKAFPGDRRVEWFLGGRRLGEVQVAGEWRRYKLPLGPLAPGETTLTLACREPAIAANAVLSNDDPRALGLAVGSWRIEDGVLLDRRWSPAVYSSHGAQPRPRHGMDRGRARVRSLPAPLVRGPGAVVRPHRRRAGAAPGGRAGLAHVPRPGRDHRSAAPERVAPGLPHLPGARLRRVRPLLLPAVPGVALGGSAGRRPRRHPGPRPFRPARGAVSPHGTPPTTWSDLVEYRKPI